MPVNLLTANQANGTDALSATTGLVTTGAGSTVTSSTTQKASGSRSIKCVCAGSGTGEGVKTTTTTVPIAAQPMTFQAAVFASVEVDVTLVASSSTASFSATTTVTVPATTWTTIQVSGTPVAAATDGVLSVKTGETQACDLYVDQLGAWYGVGGTWVQAGAEVPLIGGVNTNTAKFYDGLAPISDVEKANIAAGKNDNNQVWS